MKTKKTLKIICKTLLIVAFISGLFLLSADLIRNQIRRNISLEAINDANRNLVDLSNKYKGNLYEVLAIAQHSETNEPMVIYQDIEKRGSIWARPASMWFDEVKPGVKRFSIKFQVKRK